MGIHIDNRLSFDDHVSQPGKKARKKMHACDRIFRYVETSKRRVFVNSFITSQFSYCPLIWVFHSQRIEHKINRIHWPLLINFSRIINRRKNMPAKKPCKLF